MDIYQQITDQIVSQLESSLGDWTCPWLKQSSMPVNVLTGKHYCGINIPLLWSREFASPFWGTLKQWNQLGASIRKGESSTLILFWKIIERTESLDGATSDDDEELHTDFKFAVPRTYRVFNAVQVEGWEEPEKSKGSDVELIDAADLYLHRTQASIVFGGTQAFYSPGQDYIALPQQYRFRATQWSNATQGYYSTAFHELVHWSGHPQRCNRTFGARFGDDAYSFEELVAELGACFLCAKMDLSVQVREDHVQYIQHWLNVLKKDKKAIFTAASKATQAVDYLDSLQNSMKLQKVS